MTNLEPLCAKYGHRMIRNMNNISIQDQENTVTKALGVLVEGGLYAMCVFLLSCSKKEYGRKILLEDLQGMWRDPGVRILEGAVQTEPSPLLKDVRRVTEDLPRLILTRKITEQALTFARYHAKAGVSMNREEG
jgi:hypothetical protein